MEQLLFRLKKYIPAKVFALLQPAYHFLLAFFAALRYGFPASKLKVIGVTGTKGKTTTVELLHAVLAESGAPVASLSSLRFKIGEREIQNKLKMTMPGRFFVQKFLRDALRAGAAYVILEVPSQGIAQFRHRFIRFHTAVMTNVAPEHLEAHGGFENYLRSKLDLFWRLPKTSAVVINHDDPVWPRFSAATGAHKIFYSSEEIVFNARAWKIEHPVIGDQGISFSCHDIPIVSSLLGTFNFYNILAAMAVGLAEHVSLERIGAGVGKVSGIAGRMEFVQKTPFQVVVDYAHTPDSLRNVYAFFGKNKNVNPVRSSRGALNPAFAQSVWHSSPGQAAGHSASNGVKNRKKKLICVLGATGGGRDRWKRPEFAKIAEEFCYEIIVTNEDPYDEDAEAIVDQIVAGFSHTQEFRKIMDRREAIRAAVHFAQPGDTVVITGKGSEPWIMGPEGEKIPWDDRAVAREELERLR